VSDPSSVVADADVLAADLLVGGAAREALDAVRRHSWVDLVATGPLLDDAEAVVSTLAEPELAADHCAKVAAESRVVDQEPGNHPALAAAHRGGAAHLLTLDDRLTTAGVGASLRKHVDVSVRTPAAFARVFDPEPLYEAVKGGNYPGPDRDPRA
jgi:hypothetical protein